MVVFLCSSCLYGYFESFADFILNYKISFDASAI